MMACCDPPPAQAAQSRVAVVDDPPRIQAFLDDVNPHHSGRAGDPTVGCWAAVAEPGTGALLAVGALTRRVEEGTAYLASIATAPRARGQGLGAAVTAFLTLRAFEEGGAVCTLAHYHPNELARRLYLRLGYRTVHRNVSAPIVAR